MKRLVLSRILFLLIISLTSGCNERSKVPPEDLSDKELQAVTAPENSIRVPIDVAESIIAWRGTKLGGIRGHEGTLQFEQSDLFLKDNHIVGGYFIVNMKSLEVTDIPEEQASAKNNLKNHLKSEFKTTEYPWSTFEITRITSTGSDELKVSGNLAIRGITKTIQVPLKMEATRGPGKVMTTDLNLARSDWNIGEDGSWLEKRVVDDEFSLTISIVY